MKKLEYENINNNLSLENTKSEEFLSVMSSVYFNGNIVL